MIKKIDHVGIVVKDIDAALAFLRKAYGAEMIWRKVFPEQKLESAFIRMGENQIEIFMPTDSEGPISKFIRNRGEGIHHISLEVDDIKRTTRDLEKQKLRVIGEVNTEEFSASFVHPENNMGVLFELIERKK